MQEGAFVVYESEDTRDITFEKRKGVEIPEEQMELRDEVARSLTILRLIFKEDNDPGFQLYFKPLLSLSQVGLVGEAQPELAKRALRTLKADILSRESGRLKNKYMKKLGVRSLVLGGIALLPPFLMVSYISQDILSFFYLWAGCMAGVWLSFGARKKILEFEELGVMEEDRMEPIVRLIFTGLLTLFLGLLFSTEAVSVSIGNIDTNAVDSDIRVALLIGVACGLSEKILATRLTQKAAEFISFT
jgi:hypothetical protein